MSSTPATSSCRRWLEFLYRITEPLLAPIRTSCRFGRARYSPIILILIIMFIQRVITYYIYPSRILTAVRGGSLALLH